MVGPESIKSNHFKNVSIPRGGVNSLLPVLGNQLFFLHSTSKVALCM